MLPEAVETVNLNIKYDNITGSFFFCHRYKWTDFFKFPSNDKIDLIMCPVPGVVSPVVS